MEDMFVSIGQDGVKISKEVFSRLFDGVAFVREYSDYKEAVEKNHITLKKLKQLAEKGDIPFPLFFAPLSVVKKQILDFEKNLEDKLPDKDEIVLSARGVLQIKEIQLIVKDLGKKQEFLKKFVLQNSSENTYIGSIRKLSKSGLSTELLALKIREYFGINLQEFRGMSKERGLSYLCGKIEEKGILVSFSSWNYMPQNLKREVEISGLCIKDKKFPYIFINTRDGDEDPIILESAGRQIFTTCSMLVCIGMGIFAFNTRDESQKDSQLKKVFSITGELLVPGVELVNKRIDGIESLKKVSSEFKVTPSMLLVRLRETGLLSEDVVLYYRELLSFELSEKKTTPKNQIHPVKGYAKYNGERLSREIVGAYRVGVISPDQARNILFRRGKKMNRAIFQEYIGKFS